MSAQTSLTVSVVRQERKSSIRFIGSDAGGQGGEKSKRPGESGHDCSAYHQQG